jgi:lysyl endopeptidase
MKKQRILFFLFLWSSSLMAQIEFPGKPWSMERKLKSIPECIDFPGLTPAQSKAYVESLVPELKAMAFAYPFDTLLSSNKQGTWETLSNGSKIWRLSIYSPKALSINLIFKRFKLPRGAMVYLYTPDYETIRGAFTSENRTISDVLATTPIPGDRVIVELNLPANPEFFPDLEISRVSHDFLGFFKTISSLKSSGDCNVDINCPAGANWQIEKKSVVKFIRGGVWLCSGALINNTRNDGRALLLSANHTIGNETHARETVFFFRYERPNCGSGSGTLQYTMSGSKLLATTSKVDFSLVELSTVPPSNYEPYYAGWDRRLVTFWDTVTCIHHPSGDVKKISKSYRKVLTADFGGGYDKNTHWNISEWDLGTTEPGSSGSPLFNTDHRIIGDLTGGFASCSYNKNDYFQKFSVSWDSYPDSSNQLKYWLDPEGTGAFVINGYDPFSGGKPLANFSIRPDQIQVGRKVYFTDLSIGLPNEWLWTSDNGVPSSSNLKVPPPIKFNEPGIYHVTLYVSNELGRDSLQQTVAVTDYPYYAISESRVVPDHQIVLSDKSSGNPVSLSWSVDGASIPSYSGSNFELSFAKPGEYNVKEMVEFNDFSKELIHYNQIRVIPEQIAYRSYSFSNVDPDEHTTYTKMESQGYFPGSNNRGIIAYAESFRNNSDSIFIINGITVPLELISKWSADYYLPLVIWNANKQVVMRDSILISNFVPESRFTKWLRSPVNFDTLIYVGFEVKPWEQGTFISRMAVDRGENGPNTAMVLKGTQWLPAIDYAGIRTSLDISLETSVLMTSYNQEIKILPNYNDGFFTVDMGELVFDKVDITIFNVKGQQVTAEVTRKDGSIDFQILPAISGVYIVRLIIDKYQFSTKLMIINQ